MKTILEELWYGNLNPQEKIFHRGTQYEQAMQMLCKNENELLALLSEKETEILKKYQKYQNELMQYNSADAFVTGFRLGTRLLIEAFCEEDGFFTDLI